MKLTFTPRAWKHYQYWQDNDRRTLARINDLIRECMRTPTEGLGQPEALKAELSGFWSRRIDQKNRLVYAVTDTHIEIVQCRYHYDDR